jgi:hypothetical protein
MELLQDERPSRSLFRLPAAETASRWKVGVLQIWKRFLTALVRGLTVCAA